MSIMLEKDAGADGEGESRPHRDKRVTKRHRNTHQTSF
jgi:hypothetical protein